MGALLRNSRRCRWAALPTLAAFVTLLGIFAPNAPAAVLAEYRREDLPVAESSIGRSAQARLILAALGFALAAIAACIGLALLIAAGPFHTPPGSLA